MNIDGFEVSLVCCTKIHQHILFEVVIRSAKSPIVGWTNVSLDSPDITNFLWKECEGGKVRVQALSSKDEVPTTLLVTVENSEQRVEIDVSALRSEAHIASTKNYLARSFERKIQEMNSPKILDIGGRNRSKIEHSQNYPNAEVTVMDILPGENVDQVGDAHRLSKYFKKRSFDAVYSISVFEHLMMPWKVILEMNQVLKKGGIGFISTHQSLGMHDLPCDFWRFSEFAWDSLLNEKTGFEVIERQAMLPCYIVPFLHTKDRAGYEASAGFELSCVIFRKIGETKLRWPVDLAEISEAEYPH